MNQIEDLATQPIPLSGPPSKTSEEEARDAKIFGLLMSAYYRTDDDDHETFLREVANLILLRYRKPRFLTIWREESKDAWWPGYGYPHPVFISLSDKDRKWFELDEEQPPGKVECSWLNCHEPRCATQAGHKADEHCVSFADEEDGATIWLSIRPTFKNDRKEGAPVRKLDETRNYLFDLFNPDVESQENTENLQAIIARLLSAVRDKAKSDTKDEKANTRTSDDNLVRIDQESYDRDFLRRVERTLMPLRSRLDSCFPNIKFLNANEIGEEIQRNLWCVVRFGLPSGSCRALPPPRSGAVGSKTDKGNAHYQTDTSDNIFPIGDFQETDYLKFNYTISLLASERQQTAAESVWRDLDESKKTSISEAWQQERGYDLPSHSDLLAYPVSPRGRSVADSVLTSGCIDFGLPSERYSKDSVGKHRSWEGEFVTHTRRDFENLFYDRVYGNDKARDIDHAIFFMPIFIAGVPWMALYTFWPTTGAVDDDTEYWDKCYITYRDVRPIVANRLEIAAVEAYEEAVCKIIREQIKPGETNWNNLDECLNEELSFVARVYPFERLEFHSEPLHRTEKPILTEPTWYLRFQPNDAFAAVIENDHFDRDALLRTVGGVLSTLRNEEMRLAIAEYEGQVSFARLQRSIIHEIKNDLVSISGKINKTLSPNNEIAKSLVDDLQVAAETVYNLRPTGNVAPDFNEVPQILSCALYSCKMSARSKKDQNLKDLFLSLDAAEVALDNAPTFSLPPVIAVRSLSVPARALFVVLKNLIYDAWRFCGVQYDSENKAQFTSEEARRAAFIHITVDLEKHIVTISNGARVPQTTIDNSFQRIDDFPTGFVTPVSPFWPPVSLEKMKDVSWLKGSVFAQGIAESLGLQVRLKRNSPSGICIVCSQNSQNEVANEDD